MTWILAAIVFAATCAAFLPALDGRWLEWDDRELLLDTQRWRGLSFDHLAWMFTTFHMGPYQPLSWASYALDHELWGLDPRGYHLTNLLLHAGTAVCLFFLARKLFTVALSTDTEVGRSLRAGMSRAWIDATAALTALSWSVHPLRVESVAWITERRDCLSGLFFVATLLAWLAYVERAPEAQSRRWYRIALLLFVASLLSKGLGMVLPLVLLALDVWPLRRFADVEGPVRLASSRLRELVVEKWPFWIAGLLAAVLAWIGQRATGALVEEGTHGWLARCMQAAYGLAFYVRKTVWPSDLMVLDPIPFPFDTSQMRFVASAIGVAIVAALLVGRRRRWPAAVVAFFSYAVLVAPVLGLVQAGSQLVASRYSYLPAIPLSLLAGGMLLVAIRHLLERRSGLVAERRTIGAVALIPCCAVLFLFGRATVNECRTWHDSFALWQHDLAIDPKSGPARRSLIVAWMNQGQESSDRNVRERSFRTALDEVRKGIEQGPDPMYFNHAAKVYSLMASDSPSEERHDLELALDHARRGIELLERSTLRKPEVYETCGVILSRLDRAAEAIPMFEKAVALDPSSAMRHGLLAGALLQCGRAREAVVELEAARRIEPDNTSVWLELGNARRADGQRDAAIEAYRRVLAIQQSRLGLSAANDEEYGLAYQALQELGQAR